MYGRQRSPPVVVPVGAAWWLLGDPGSGDAAGRRLLIGNASPSRHSSQLRGACNALLVSDFSRQPSPHQGKSVSEPDVAAPAGRTAASPFARKPRVGPGGTRGPARRVIAVLAAAAILLLGLPLLVRVARGFDKTTRR